MSKHQRKLKAQVAQRRRTHSKRKLKTEIALPSPQGMIPTKVYIPTVGVVSLPAAPPIKRRA